MLDLGNPISAQIPAQGACCALHVTLLTLGGSGVHSATGIRCYRWIGGTSMAGSARDGTPPDWVWAGRPVSPIRAPLTPRQFRGAIPRELTRPRTPASPRHSATNAEPPGQNFRNSARAAVLQPAGPASWSRRESNPRPSMDPSKPTTCVVHRLISRSRSAGGPPPSSQPRGSRPRRRDIVDGPARISRRSCPASGGPGHERVALTTSS